MKRSRIAFLQPLLPHYRIDFFNYIEDGLGKTDIYTFEKKNKVNKAGFSSSSSNLHVKNLWIGRFLWYNPFTFWSKKYDTLVLMWHFAHLSTWFLLLTKWFHRKKIILWGQGISVKRYLKEEKRPDRKLKWMLNLADGAWVYMNKEYEQWHSLFPNKPIVALGNTISGLDNIISYIQPLDNKQLKIKYKIHENIIFIFCARFSSSLRRTDILEKVINELSQNDFGFIIIGDGKYKPDFSMYKNVYDFGSVYDSKIKQELFSLSDAYFQPAYMGLSIVEAMAYGKPVLTMNRTEEFKQGVELDYIKHKENGLLFDSYEDCINTLQTISKDELKRMGVNARNMVGKVALPQNMAQNAIKVLEQIKK